MQKKASSDDIASKRITKQKRNDLNLEFESFALYDSGFCAVGPVKAPFSAANLQNLQKNAPSITNMKKELC